jgi:MerR family redox-sensitive transcriptional activator SoxR
MGAWKIGDVARRVGLRPSALRYYERVGLLPKPRRSSRQRCYDPEIIGRLEIIRVAREAGFSIRETRLFLTGFASATKPSERWRSLAERKLVEVEDQIRRAETMKVLLKESFRCRCPRLEDCERYLSLGKTERGLRVCS